MAGFKILDTLTLDGSNNEHVQLVPTKKFFKAVLVMNAPLTVETARLIGAQWAFDGAGNPQSFEGTIKLTIELTRAAVTIAGKITAPVDIISESVKHLAVFRHEKHGMRIRFRVHLPEDRDQLIRMLDFLSDLNKDTFAVTIVPDSLFTAGGDRGADAQGGAARAYPFKHLKGRKTHLLCEVKTAPAKSAPGFISSWEMKAILWPDSPADGRMMDDDSHIYPGEDDAKAAAFEELLGAIRALNAQNGSLDEVNASAAAIDWILEQVPALKRDEAGRVYEMKLPGQQSPSPEKPAGPAKAKTTPRKDVN